MASSSGTIRFSGIPALALETWPNLRHLHAFLEVARRGRINEATSAVGRSQPAISQAINGLEAQLGATLFRRSHAGMFLTDAGHLFQKKASITNGLAG